MQILLYEKNSVKYRGFYIFTLYQLFHLQYFSIQITISPNFLIKFHSKYLVRYVRSQLCTSNNSNHASKQLKYPKLIIEKFTTILKNKSINCQPQIVIKLLFEKYVQSPKYLQKQNSKTPQKDRNHTEINKSHKSNKINYKQKFNPKIISIIDLSDDIEKQLHSKAQSNKNLSKTFRKDEIVIIDSSQVQDEPFENQKDDYLEFPTKTIQKQTGRGFYLLEDPFTPKNYKESLVQNFIDFRNRNFSETMPVSRAQQRKSENQQKTIQQKFNYTQDIIPDQNSKRYKRSLGPPLESEPLWKNRIKPDIHYMSSLAQVWTLQESCMTKKKELIKRFHEEREAAKLLITHGYGIKTVKHMLELFDNKKVYHKTAYSIVKQAFRCIEEELIQKYQKTIKPLTLNNFRKVMCFLTHYHDSFKDDEERKDIFSQYIKIAYIIETQHPQFQQSVALYNFILKDVLPEQEYDHRIIHID